MAMFIFWTSSADTLRPVLMADLMPFKLLFLNAIFAVTAHGSSENASFAAISQKKDTSDKWIAAARTVLSCGKNEGPMTINLNAQFA